MPTLYTNIDFAHVYKWCTWHLYYSLSKGSRKVLQSSSRAVAVVVVEEEEVVGVVEVGEMAMLVDSVGRAMGGKC